MLGREEETEGQEGALGVGPVWELVKMEGDWLLSRNLTK